MRSSLAAPASCLLCARRTNAPPLRILSSRCGLAIRLRTSKRRSTRMVRALTTSQTAHTISFLSAAGHRTPKWGQSFMFNLTGKEDVLHVMVYDKDLIGQECIGRVDLAWKNIDFKQAKWWVPSLAVRLVHSLLLMKSRLLVWRRRLGMRSTARTISPRYSDPLVVVEPRKYRSIFAWSLVSSVSSL